MANGSPVDEPRYELREGPLFLSSVYRQVGTVAEWDAVRLFLDMALAQDPTNPRLARNVVGILWAAPVRNMEHLVLLYEVHEEEGVVIYEALVPSLD